jgi:hypothetical protein
VAGTPGKIAFKAPTRARSVGSTVTPVGGAVVSDDAMPVALVSSGSGQGPSFYTALDEACTIAVHSFSTYSMPARSAIARASGDTRPS